MATQTSLRYQEFIKWKQKNHSNFAELTMSQAEFLDELIDCIEISNKMRSLICGISPKNECFWLLVEWYKYQDRQPF